MTSIDLTNTASILTGAAGGLGSAMTASLIAAGASVLAVVVSAKALDKLAGAVASNRVVTAVADIRQAETCAALIDQAVERCGAINALINNAGVGQASIRKDYYVRGLQFWEVPDERWRAILETNAMAPFMLAKAIIPHLMDQGWGRIVNVTTSLDTMIRPGWTPYGPSKAALAASSAIWAADLAGTGVSVNVLVPGGPANTAMVPPASSPDRAAMIQPDVMKAPIRWLLSRESDGITGRRFLGVRWDDTVPYAQAVEASSAPAAWSQLGIQSIWPGRIPGE